jgi:hypothetical protein
MDNNSELKYLWLSLKNIINKYTLNKKYLEKINQNIIDLDKERKYDRIKVVLREFINDNIENIINSILIKMDFVDIHYLDRQLSIWKGIDKDYKNDSINHSFLHLLNGVSSQTDQLYNDILKMYVKYVTTKNEKYIYDIVNLAIKNNKSSILHIFRNKIDFSYFIKDNCNKNIDELQQMKSHKLINYFVHH